MNNSRFKLYLIITLVLSGLLPIAGSIFFHLFLSDRYWVDEPLHSVVEAVGSFTALSLALLILILKKNKGVPSYYIWVSCALIGMGLLDVFHAFSPPGDSFILLHGMAILVGGFLFAMVWLPNHIAQSRLARTLSIVVTVVVAIIFGVFAAAFPDTLPSMINKGVFTTAANSINILSGLFFLLAAVYFVIRYRSDHRIEDFLFANFCLLNGWVGLLFPLSQLWNANWWFWHLLRLIAYFTAISYMFITFQRSEKELRERERSYRTLSENLPGIVYRLFLRDNNNSMQFFNSLVQPMTGYSINELTTGEVCSLDPLILSEDRDRVITAVKRAVMENQAFQVEYRLRHKKGDVRHFLERGRPVYGADGSPLYVDGVIFDFTERKHAEENISKLLEELKTIFENLPLGIAYIDAEFKFLRANKFFYNLTGLSEEGLIGKLCYETVGEYADSTKKGHEKICSFCKKDECFNTKRPTVIERPLMGSIVKVTTVPQLDKDGNIFRFLEIVEDITERKLSEAALLESELRYRTLVESSPDTIAIHSEGKIVFINRAGAKLLGAANPEQLIGKEIMDFVHPDYRESAKERIKRTKEEGENIPLTEEKLIRQDGSVIDVEITATPFIYQGKHGVQVIIRDITEKKMLEAQLLRAQRMESIGTLASGIAHDINNVLTPMMLSLQLLQEKFTDDESQKLLNVLERSAQRGASLMKQVLSFAKGVEGERKPFKYAPYLRNRADSKRDISKKY